MSDPPRLSSLAVLGGPLHGKSLQLSRDLEEITIGSDPSCRFRLDLAGVAPVHARLVADETGAAVFATPGSRGLFLNFEEVEGRAALSDGDMLRLGPPQERDSVMIQLEFGGPLLEGEPPIFASAESTPPPPAPAASAPPAPEAAQAPPFAATEGAGPAPAVSDDAEAAFIRELSSSDDDAFVLPDEPAAKAPPAEASPVTQGAPVIAAPPIVEAGPVVADEFFVAAEVEAPPPPPPPPSAAPTSSVAFDMPEGDFALPSFDPNWATPAAPAPKPAADESFVGDSPAPAADDAFALPPLAKPRPPPPAPAEGWSVGGDEAPLVFDEAPQAPPPKPAAPVPVAAKPRPESAPADAAAAPARPRPPRRPPEEGAPVAPRPARPAATRARAPTPSPVGRYVALGGGGLAVLGMLAFVAMRFLGGGAKVTAVDPPRAKVGQTVAITGGPFSADPAANEVLFGDKPGNVLEADGSRLTVQVPDLALTPGKDAQITLRVRVAGKDSRPFEITVFGGPTVVGISPDVAMTGEEVVLAGSGWGAAPTVQFGDMPAEVLQVSPTSIRLRVPGLSGGPGTAAAVVVKDGPAESNPAPFFLGRIPLLVKVEPASAVPGDLITLSGRGFRREPPQNTVTIGGARALVTSAIDSELRVVAPFNAVEGSGGLQLRVPGSENVAQASLTILPSSDTVDFHFAAQPFDAVPGRDHAVLWSGLGPAFVVAASSGKTAAERAYEAQTRLNQAGTILKASRDVDIELRNPDTAPALALTGKSEVILEVSEEDVTAYNEDWTGLKGRGGAVTRTRLGRWWAAVAKDLVLMLVRGAKPVNAPGLAPEGRVLLDVSQAAQKTGRFGVPWSVVAGFRPAQRDALRVVAFRVPATVTGPGGAPAAGAQAATLKLEGSWVGTEVEDGQRRYISASFQPDGGTISIEAAVTLSLPLLTLEARKNEAHWSLQFRGGTRYYTGKWDGQLLTGTIATDPAGKEAVGTFELKPR